MAINVSAVPPVLPSEAPFRPIGSEIPQATPAGGSFAGRLAEAVHDVNELQKTATTLGNEYAQGRNNDIHGVVVAGAQADISLRLLANVRNRIIEAYREVMRMGA